MQSKLMYITEDGIAFESEETAKAHEREIQLKGAFALLWLDIIENDRITEDGGGNPVIAKIEDFVNVMLWREKEILAIFQGIK